MPAQNEAGRSLKAIVFMLTAVADVSNRIQGLEIGADDYVVKPFSPSELEARIKAVLRRTVERTQDASDCVCQCVSLQRQRGPEDTGPPAVCGNGERRSWHPILVSHRTNQSSCGFLTCFGDVREPALW